MTTSQSTESNFYDAFRRHALLKLAATYPSKAKAIAKLYARIVCYWRTFIPNGPRLATAETRYAILLRLTGPKKDTTNPKRKKEARAQPSDKARYYGYLSDLADVGLIELDANKLVTVIVPELGEK